MTPEKALKLALKYAKTKLPTAPYTIHDVLKFADQIYNWHNK